MLKVTDAAGNDGTVADQAYELDTTAPSTTASGIDISDDTGASATDFVTNVASQTVTATLSAPLAAGEVLYGSLDGGSTWIDITGSVSGSDVSWSGVTLSGSGSIVLKVSDSAGNDGTLANQAYEFDASAPTTTLSNLAFSDDTGVANDFFTSVPEQTISATLSNVLGAGELVLGSLDGGTTWTDVTAYVSGTDLAWSGVTLNSGANELRLLVTDEAGNDGDLEVQTYRLGPQVAVSQGGSNYTEQAEFNTDPNANVDYVWIGGAGSEAVQGTDEDDFLAARAGDDAANGGGGNDIMDGGTGSNFLTGGAGVDRFFIDARDGQTTWSTITDFDRGAGEEVSLWGWQAGTSRATWLDSDGVAGWEGVTMHADIDGNGVTDTSITWTGLTRSDLPVPMEMTSPDGTALLWFV
jgi:Ca2+-binding RTX toxin-like protein